MGKKALSSRNNWQTQSGPGGLAGTAEKIYILCSKEHLKEPFMKQPIIPTISNIYMKMSSYHRKHLLKFTVLMRLQWKPSENADGEYPQTFQSQIPVQEKSYLVK